MSFMSTYGWYTCAELLILWHITYEHYSERCWSLRVICIVLLKTRHSKCALKVQRFLLKAYYPWTYLLTASFTMWKRRREQYDAIWQRKSQLSTLYWQMQRHFSKGSAGWKKPTQNNISSIHSSQLKYQFSSYMCHWYFLFLLTYEHSFKEPLTSLK